MRLNGYGIERSGRVYTRVEPACKRSVNVSAPLFFAHTKIPVELYVRPVQYDG